MESTSTRLWSDDTGVMALVDADGTTVICAAHETESARRDHSAGAGERRVEGHITIRAAQHRYDGMRAMGESGRRVRGG